MTPDPSASASPAGDTIALRGLACRGYHGVFEHERRDGQTFVVDAVLTVDTRAAAASDDLRETVDYGGLAQRLAAIVEGDPVDLIETLAARLVEACLTDGRVRAAEVTVHKPQAPIPAEFADVAVTVRRERPPATAAAVVALGSNLGDRAAHLALAVRLLAAHDDIVVERVSPVYETDPVGGPSGQEAYLNAVALLRTSLPPHSLLGVLHVVEEAADRVRVQRWGPRTLDLDLVTYAGARSADPALTLPHPRAHERAFVLAPWADVDPGAELPGHGRVADLLDRADTTGVRRCDGVTIGGQR